MDGRRLIRVAFGCAPSVCACAAHLSIALAGFHKPAQRDGVTASYSIDVFVLYSPAGGFFLCDKYLYSYRYTNIIFIYIYIISIFIYLY